MPYGRSYGGGDFYDGPGAFESLVGNLLSTVRSEQDRRRQRQFEDEDRTAQREERTEAKQARQLQTDAAMYDRGFTRGGTPYLPPTQQVDAKGTMVTVPTAPYTPVETLGGYTKTRPSPADQTRETATDQNRFTARLVAARLMGDTAQEQAILREMGAHGTAVPDEVVSSTFAQPRGEVSPPKPELREFGGKVYKWDPGTQSLTLVPNVSGTDRRTPAPVLKQNERGEWVPVDPETGLDASGKPVAGPRGAKPTEFEQKSAAYYRRATDGEGNLGRLEKVGYTPGAWATALSRTAREGGIKGALANATLGAKDQQFLQAAQQFINAINRRDSGANITAVEWEDAFTRYLPRKGDSKQVRAQKAQARRIEIEGLKSGSGTAETGAPASGGQPKTLDETKARIKELRAQGMSKEAIRAQLLAEGYPIE
jgi:hypothetical protein